VVKGMRGEELMTDEQFNKYNELLGLVDDMLKNLPDQKQEEFSEKKAKILTNQTD
jgi:hypothetical protein